MAEKAKAGSTGDPYLLDTDPVSGEKLGPPEKLVVVQHEGRELRFANEQNAKALQADPQKYVAAVDAALVRQQMAFYPLQTCVVSGEKLDAQGIDVIGGSAETARVFMDKQMDIWAKVVKDNNIKAD